MGEAKRKKFKQEVKAAGDADGRSKPLSEEAHSQDEKNSARLESLNKAVDQYLGSGDVVAALGICVAAMDQYKFEKQPACVMKAANVLIRVVFSQLDRENFISIAKSSADVLDRHSLRSKDLANAIGRHYENTLCMQDACKKYMENIQVFGNAPDCWQGLLRSSTTLAVAGSPEALDSCLYRLFQQDEALFHSVVIAVLNTLEGSRPEDFYLLASRAHAIIPTDLVLWWYWICTMSFVEREAPQVVALHTKAWARQFMSLLPDSPYTQRLAPVNGRRIRIGYIASRLHFMFLCNHIPHHDFNRFDILIFTDDPRCLPGFFGPHVSIYPLGSGDPTDHLRQARLDIAIEMMGPSYRANWRGIEGFSAFARRIAPVQCHWISTISTYGMTTGFDYLIADENLVPQSLEHLYTEKIKRLPNVAHCWVPPQGRFLTKSPVETNQFITFGSANRGAKVTLETLNRWACVVAAVPDSRMLIKGFYVKDALFRARAQDIFNAHGVKHRLSFADATPPPKFPGDFYSQIDISLDTFPYGGGITTLESLWNGVPVITLKGTSFVSRLAANYLDLIGQACWVADTDKAYVEIAAALAADRNGLIEARSTLQARLAASPLLDGQRFARDLENAFMEMLQEI